MNMGIACVAFPVLFLVSTITAVITTERLSARVAMARAIRAGDAASWTIRTRAMQTWQGVILLTLLCLQWIVTAGLLFLLWMSV